jgi:hypothetical protein
MNETYVEGIEEMAESARAKRRCRGGLPLIVAGPED